MVGNAEQIVAAITPTDIALVLGALTAFVGSIAAFVKLRPESRGMYISNEQGMQLIYTNLTKSLYGDIDRLRQELVEERARSEAKDATIAQLREEIYQLRYGRG